MPLDDNPSDPFEPESAWSAIARRTGLPASLSEAKSVPVETSAAVRSRMHNRQRESPRPWMRLAQVAGSLGAASLVGVLLFLVAPRAFRSHAFAGAPTYVTAAAHRETVTLVDGTQFALAPGSRLWVDPAYARGQRRVALEGEGYFTVVHNVAHPFEVLVRNTVVQDVGTQFDVRAYPNDSVARVAVVEGEVRLGRNAVSAGDLALASDTAVVVRHQADVASATAWTSGTLAFDGTSLADVLAELSRWYGVEIRFADPHDRHLASRHVAATFPPLPLSAVLAAIAPTVSARVDRVGTAYVLTSLSSSATP